ncbi:MAG: SprB repeat-containing protein [Lewinellaceae bacterium]|nr:SprB repeat-containing protein [Lewinellaceae bacterium]
MGQTFTPYFKKALQTVLFAFAIAPALLNSQNPFQAFLFTTTIDCNTGYGYASVSVTGDYQPPLTYLWSNGLTTSNVVIGPGPISVTVTDANGQTATASDTLTLPPQLFVEVVAENQICTAAPDGSVTAIPYGGTPPYSYSWSVPPGGTTAQITGLGAGVYTVTVTDAAGCTAVGSGEVINTDEGIWLMMTPTDITCYGAMDGMLEVGPMSGTAPYSYLWSTGDTTKKINNLGPGTYGVTVTDANGCTGEITGTVIQPPNIIIFLTSPIVTCDTTACATVHVQGGTPPYTIFWSNGLDSTTICDLTPGGYYVTVTDVNGCSKVDSIFIGINPIMLEIEFSNIGCANCNLGGSATATGSGGTGSYQYDWSNGCTTSTCTDLPAGTNYVTVTDLNSGCTATDSVLITTCPLPEIEFDSIGCAGCNGGGLATAFVVGGTGSYSFLWSSGCASASCNDLMAGLNYVTVTDLVSGCVITDSVFIPSCAPLEIDVTVTADATCAVGGTATLTITNGTAPYSILWDNGQTGDTATGLMPGMHSVTVTDATGCVASATFNVGLVPGPDASASTISHPSCTTNFLGSAEASATGGQTPYMFLWDNGETTATAMSLSAGNHCVTVTDSNGCTDTACVTMNPVNIPMPSITIMGAATCNQGATVSVTVTGGMPPFSYLWSNMATSGTVMNLPPGTYTVTVTDATSCTGTASVTIFTPPNPTVVIVSSTNVTCTDNGGATAASGGAAPLYLQLEQWRHRGHGQFQRGRNLYCHCHRCWRLYCHNRRHGNICSQWG